MLELPFIVMGSTLFTLLPGMEFAPLAAAKTGGDIQTAQAALQPWFVPILATGNPGSSALLSSSSRLFCLCWD